MSALAPARICPAPPAPCPRVAVQRVAYRTIGREQYDSQQVIRLNIMMRVQPSLDLGPFVDTARLDADLLLATFDVVVENQDSLQHIGNIVAQYLTRKTILYCNLVSRTESAEVGSLSNLHDRLPPILVTRSSLLFAVRSWPCEKESLLLADDILVEDMLILQDWNTTSSEISSPGDLTLYCVLASVRVLVAGEVD